MSHEEVVTVRCPECGADTNIIIIKVVEKEPVYVPTRHPWYYDYPHYTYTIAPNTAPPSHFTV